MMTEETIKAAVEAQRAYFRSDETLPVSFRLEQLKRLKLAVQVYEQEIAIALHTDLGRSDTEAYLAETGALILEINEAMQHLKRWAKPEVHYSGLHTFPSVLTKVYKVPYGVTLIISPFNFPFLLSLGVLVAYQKYGGGILFFYLGTHKADKQKLKVILYYLLTSGRRCGAELHFFERGVGVGQLKGAFAFFYYRKNKSEKAFVKLHVLIFKIAHSFVFAFKRDNKNVWRSFSVGSVRVRYSGSVKENLTLLYSDLFFTRYRDNITLFGINKLPKVVGFGMALKIFIKFEIVYSNYFADNKQIFKLVLIIFFLHEYIVAFFYPIVNRFLVKIAQYNYQ